MPGRPARPLLLERAGELETIDRLAAQALAGSGGLVVVEGRAGVGKTSLLRAAAHSARESRLDVRSARATTLERKLGFGVTHQLLGPVSAASGTGRAGFGPLSDLFAALERLARARPVLLTVDDLQWADPPSVRWLRYVVPRLASLEVLVVVATRPREESAGSADAAGLALDPEVTVLRPRPLSAAAARTLVRSVAAQASEADCDACHAATRGNPLFLRELATALAGGHRLGDGAIPATVDAAVARRLAPLSASARAFAEATAVLGAATSAHRCALLAGLESRVALAAWDELVVTGILAPVRIPAFVHPIVEEAVAAGQSPARRACWHARSADLLHEAGAEVGQVAAHLLASEPCGRPEIVTRLRTAATAVLREGSPEAAIPLLVRALEEPPVMSQRGALLLELGGAEMLASRLEAAERHLRSALAMASGPELRLRAGITLCELLAAEGRTREAVIVLDAEVERAGGACLEIAEHAEALLLNVGVQDAAANAALAPRSRRLRDRILDGGVATAGQLAAVAAGEAMAGDSAARTAEIAERAIAQLSQEPELDVRACAYAARSLVAADALPAAEAALRAGLVREQRTGSGFGVTLLAGTLAEARYRAGALAEAERLARTALDAARGEGWASAVAPLVAILVWTLTALGRLDDVPDVLAAADIEEPDPRAAAEYPVEMARHARGRWRLARGDAAGALADLEATGRQLVACGEPTTALVPWRSDATHAMLALGRTSEAHALAAEDVVRARSCGAAGPLGAALLALAAASTGSPHLAVLREAVIVLEPSPARLVRAAALAALGLELGPGAEARETLSAALELAHECGAAPLEIRVRRGLARVGARPRRAARSGPAALTAAERRVAMLAAEGLTNQEIADRLVVTIRTVELHLTHTFRKLGVSRRAEIGDRLGSAARRE